jgi:hypothetical protein
MAKHSWLDPRLDPNQACCTPSPAIGGLALGFLEPAPIQVDVCLCWITRSYYAAWQELKKFGEKLIAKQNNLTNSRPALSERKSTGSREFFGPGVIRTNVNLP